MIRSEGPVWGRGNGRQTRDGVAQARLDPEFGRRVWMPCLDAARGRAAARSGATRAEARRGRPGAAPGTGAAQARRRIARDARGANWCRAVIGWFARRIICLPPLSALRLAQYLRAGSGGCPDTPSSREPHLPPGRPGCRPVPTRYAGAITAPVAPFLRTCNNAPDDSCLFAAAYTLRSRLFFPPYPW